LNKFDTFIKEDFKKIILWQSEKGGESGGGHEVGSLQPKLSFFFHLYI